MSVVNKDKTGELGLETLLDNVADGHTTPIPREPLPATGIKPPGETPPTMATAGVAAQPDVTWMWRTHPSHSWPRALGVVLSDLICSKVVSP